MIPNVDTNVMRQERSNYMMLKHDLMADDIEEQKAGQQEGDMSCMH